MSFLHFIVNDVLGQASILISLIAMIGLIALKKSPGQIITGTLKTLLGFLVLLSGASIIVNALTFLGEIFQEQPVSDRNKCNISITYRDNCQAELERSLNNCERYLGGEPFPNVQNLVIVVRCSICD